MNEHLITRLKDFKEAVYLLIAVLGLVGIGWSAFRVISDFVLKAQYQTIQNAQTQHTTIFTELKNAKTQLREETNKKIDKLEYDKQATLSEIKSLREETNKNLRRVNSRIDLILTEVRK